MILSNLKNTKASTFIGRWIFVVLCTGFYATGTASVETNESSTTTTDKTWNGSSLNIGGNTSITAENENEIKIQGADIAIAGHLQLDAKDINLLAGENSSSTSSEQQQPY